MEAAISSKKKAEKGRGKKKSKKKPAKESIESNTMRQSGRMRRTIRRFWLSGQDKKKVRPQQKRPLVRAMPLQRTLTISCRRYKTTITKDVMLILRESKKGGMLEKTRSSTRFQEFLGFYRKKRNPHQIRRLAPARRRSCHPPSRSCLRNQSFAGMPFPFRRPR